MKCMLRDFYSQHQKLFPKGYSQCYDAVMLGPGATYFLSIVTSSFLPPPPQSYCTLIPARLICLHNNGIPCVIKFHLLSLFGSHIRGNSAVIFFWIGNSCPKYIKKMGLLRLYQKKKINCTK